MTDTNKIAAYLRRDAKESFLGVMVPPADALALLDERDRLIRERDHLSLQVCNAQAGDCMSGEHGTIECPVDMPCGVCKLRGENERLRRVILVCMEGMDGFSSYDVHDLVCMAVDKRDPSGQASPCDDDYIAAWCEIAALAEGDA